MSAQPWFERGGVPSDARLEKDWNADDAPAAHKAAWALYQEKEAQESAEIEASLARENDWFSQQYERPGGAS